MVERKIGLTIGIDDYSDPKLSNLRFARKDAEDIRSVLLNPDIGGFDEIIPLVNETKYNVKKGIEKLLLKDSTFNDLVLIYFSGHGKLNSKFELNLLLKDTETDYLLSTALHYNFIIDCIEESKCKKVIIILDCCHSGAAGIKGDISKTLSETSGSGTFILSATTGSNLAKEVQELENGIFTHFLLEGLMKGDADLGGDGLIDILEWYEYASKRCNDNYSQVTTIKTKFEKRIVIGKNPLKIREKEYELKKSRLLEEFVSQLPPRVLDESLTILKKNYKDPSSLEKVEGDIYRLLESLLEGDLSVENYSVAVQHLKGFSIKTSLPHSRGDRSILEPAAPTVRNIRTDDASTKQEIPKTFTSPFTGMEFMFIPAGEFIMGSPSGEEGRYDDEDTVHEVTINNPFYMGKYPVTQKQWEKVVGNNPSNFKGENRPVESVSWKDVQKFVKKLNEKEGTDKYRLPSEAEWEYACRTGTQTRYSFGDKESKLNEYAWYGNNSGSETHPVGQKKPNSWDLYDMHGNVWEWVQDKWHGKYYAAPSDGSAWEDGYDSNLVIRGGSWNGSARDCRSACRLGSDPWNHNSNLGFRLLREYTASEITPEVTEKAKSATTESSIVSKTSPQITNVQKSSFQQIKYKSSAWENKKYNVIKILGKKYVFLKPYSQNKLANLVVDSNSKYTLKTGEKLDLGQGYALEARWVDVEGKKVWLEFTKDGEFVDDQIVSTDSGDHTWTCEVDKIQCEDNVPVLKIHVNQIFQGAVDSIVQIDGLWLIDFEDAFTIKPGEKIGGYEIVEIADEYISYKLPDSDAL